MILSEISNTGDDLVLLIRNMVMQANSQNQSSYLSWVALNSLMRKIGDEQFDYDSFKSEYDKSPIIQKFVKRFDGKGIELKTLKKDSKSPQGDNTDTVAKMAKAATARRQG
jgi:hypothetical protein